MSASAEETPKVQGSYLYCIADGSEVVSLGKMGLDHSEVYTIPYRDICAIVHDCQPEPYQSGDTETVNAWVMAHQTVIDVAWARWGTVLPVAFDTIIKDEPEAGSEASIRQWIEKEYENLKRYLDNVRGKAAYGVQIFWDLRIIAQDIARSDLTIRKLEEEIKSKPKGLAYMYRQTLEARLRKELEIRAGNDFKQCYTRIRKQVDDICVHKTKKTAPPTQMLMNLSCLISMDGYARLEEELGKINEVEGFSVRLTGPWPPYSFVGGARSS